MNLAVAFTEYQLLQIQAIARHYAINNLYLITIDNDRIQNWLVDDGLFVEVLVLPSFDIKQWKRLLKSYIDNYRILLEDYLENKQTEIFIGGQDENTLFSLIKFISAPRKYWNIEDGFANYYNRKLKYQMSIWVKKKLFKHLYGYDLSIAYAHGQISFDKSFRMAPSISTGKNHHDELAPILRNYLFHKSKELISSRYYLNEKYNFEQLIITDKSHFNKAKAITDSSTVYKFHPKEKVSREIDIRILRDKIPLEMLPFICSRLKKIRFEVMSSSILNILCMDIDVKIEIAFNPNAKHVHARSNDVKRIIDYINKDSSKVVINHS